MFEITSLIAIQVFLLALGAVGGTVCAALVHLSTRRVAMSRSRMIALFVAFVFPFVAVFYLEAGFFLHDIAEEVSGRDSMVSGFSHYPLANGYRLTFFVENGGSDGYIEPPAGMLEVGQIYGVQVQGDYLFVHAAAAERRPGNNPVVTVTHGDVPQAPVSPPETRYLEIDTRTSEIRNLNSLEELQLAATRRGTTLQLISAENAYRAASSAARPGWLFLGLLFAPLVAASVWLVRRLNKLRRTSARVV